MDWKERMVRHLAHVEHEQRTLSGHQSRMASDLEATYARLRTLVDAQSRTSTQLDTILRAIEENYQMSQQDIDRLRQSVESNTNAVASANALIAGLSQQIRDAADDPEEIRALADQLDKSSQSLADAVSANTASAGGPAAAGAAGAAASAGGPGTAGTSPGANTGVPGATPSAIPGADALSGGAPAPAAGAAPANAAGSGNGDNSGGAAPAA